MSEERKNRVIFVKVPGSWKFTEEILLDWKDRLLGLGLLKRVDRTMLYFDTDHVRCRLFPGDYVRNNPDRIKGQRCDECFGFTKEETYYLRYDGNPENAYKGSELEYICEVEGVEYDRPGIDVTEITGAASGDS